MAQHTPAAAGNLLALLECLGAEYDALLVEDHERLTAVLARKEHLLAQLAADPGLALGQAQGKRSDQATAWTQALRRAGELNQRNAIVLGPRAAANRARLRFLQSTLGGVALYAADGLATSGRRAITAVRSA